ncbi:MAG: hypothetical protein KF851_14895 [Pirellulaceae bacterium]|nr:hypothetical protein [Pirellulaceae bacterium]
MNRSKPSQNTEHKSVFHGRNQKLLVFVGLLLLVIYTFSRPTLEKWLGRELPVLINLGNEATPAPDAPKQSDSQTQNSRTANESVQKDRSNPASAPESKGTEFAFEKLPRGELQSPAGLIYGFGPNREHRVDHVLLHAADNPNRPVHSVFNGNRDAILSLLDEAYELIKQKDKRVKATPNNEYPDRTEYVIDMQRAIGYRGGQNGRRDGFPKLSRLKLILADENRVISAFPF